MILSHKIADALGAPKQARLPGRGFRQTQPLAFARTVKQRGFTLIEIMIVIAIMIILMGIAVPLYQQSLVRARESVLREDLYTLRNAIDQYTLDKQRAPQTLADLTQAGYIKSIPKDPFTDSSDTWTTEMEDSMRSLDQTQPGIDDVHSGSSKSGSDGTAYNTW
jgi:general secretion pathway protein G